MKTMTIGDVKYIEAPELDHFSCKGCDLYDLFPCADNEAKAEATFGGTCGERKVIYKEVQP